MTEETPDMASGRIAIGVDVGGSGIKAAVVDVEAGRFRSERLRVATPNPSTPDAVLASVSRLVKRLAKSSGLGDATPIGIGLPGVTIDGVLKSAANIDAGWIDFPVVERVARVARAPDLDHQRRRRGRDRRDALRRRRGPARRRHLPDPRDRRRVGRVRRRRSWSRTPSSARWRSAAGAAERRSAAAARIKRGLSWKAWAADLDEHLDRIQQLMWPNLMIVGGGVSKNADKFIPRLTVRCPVVPAQLRNDAGIIGAAIVAAGSSHVAQAVSFDTVLASIAAAPETPAEEQDHQHDG